MCLSGFQTLQLPRGAPLRPPIEHNVKCSACHALAVSMQNAFQSTQSSLSSLGPEDCVSEKLYTRLCRHVVVRFIQTPISNATVDVFSKPRGALPPQEPKHVLCASLKRYTKSLSTTSARTRSLTNSVLKVPQDDGWSWPAIGQLSALRKRQSLLEAFFLRFSSPLLAIQHLSISRWIALRRIATFHMQSFDAVIHPYRKSSHIESAIFRVGEIPLVRGRSLLAL